MIKRLISTGLILSLLTAPALNASTKGDMEFLGYSDEMIRDTMKIIGYNGDIDSEDFKLDFGQITTGKNEELDEASALLNQLAELANTRSIRPDLSDRSQEIKSKINNYWKKLNPSQKSLTISNEIRNQILERIRKALILNGYQIIQVKLFDLPKGSKQQKLRAIVRITKPLKTNNSYKEIQRNLAQIKEICTQAATIDDYAYLAELTTFIAENPKNKYYYAKTILKY